MEAEGIIVLITRTEDQTVKKEARANEVKNDRPHLFLAIHQNSDGTKAKGTETYITNQEPNDNDEAFARKVQAKVYGVVQEDNRNEGNPKEAGFVVIKHSLNGNTTSCLNEATFISNPESEAKLKDDAYLDKIAEAMKQAIMDIDP